MLPVWRCRMAHGAGHSEVQGAAPLASPGGHGQNSPEVSASWPDSPKDGEGGLDSDAGVVGDALLLSKALRLDCPMRYDLYCRLRVCPDRPTVLVPSSLAGGGVLSAVAVGTAPPWRTDAERA